MAIGGVIYMHAPLADGTLSCELPQFARRMEDGSYTVATATELRLQCKLLVTAPLKEVQAAAAARPEAWLFYGRKPSELPADYYQLKPNALTLSPPASSGAPLLQLRFYLKLGASLRSFSLFNVWAGGQPKVRLLGSAEDVVAPVRDGGGLQMALRAAGLAPALLCSVHMVESAALVGSSLQPTAAEPPLPVGCATVWQPGRKDAALASVLGDSLCEGTSPEQLDEATVALHALHDGHHGGSSSSGGLLVVALTRERDSSDSKQLGGAGADPASRATVKRASTISWPVLQPPYNWELPKPGDRRVQEVLSINPDVFKPAVYEPLPLVHVNPSENRGMAQVMLHDKDLFALPQAEVYAALQRGFDSGCILNEGDMLSNARADSVEKSAAETIITTTDLLSGMPAGHPSRPLNLRLLYKAVETYEMCKSLLMKGGDFHLAKKHCMSVVLQVVLPLGGNTIKSLFVITGVDAAVTHVNKAVSFAALYEEALYTSLFRQALDQGAYPAMHTLTAHDAKTGMGDDQSELSAAKGQAWACSFLRQKAESGDVVTCAFATQLRLMHEFFELVSAQERADLPFDEEEAARFWLPLMKAAGKFHCAHSLAEKAIFKLTRYTNLNP